MPRPRRARRVPGEAPLPAEDGIDAPSWNLLTRITTTAHNTDRAGWVAAVKAMETELGGDPVPIQYWIIYLLRHFSLVTLKIDRQPTLAELESLADQLLPRWQQMVHANRRWLVTTLATVWEIDAGPPAVEYENLFIFASLALGLLIPDPATDLPRTRRAVAEWWPPREQAARDAAARSEAARLDPDLL
jgi:hypothetical protein